MHCQKIRLICLARLHSQVHLLQGKSVLNVYEYFNALMVIYAKY